MKNILVDFEGNPIKEEDCPFEVVVEGGEETHHSCLVRITAAIKATHGEGITEATVEELLVLAYLQGAMDMIMDQELAELELEEEIAFHAIPNKSKIFH